VPGEYHTFALALAAIEAGVYSRASMKVEVAVLWVRYGAGVYPRFALDLTLVVELCISSSTAASALRGMGSRGTRRLQGAAVLHGRSVHGSYICFVRTFVTESPHYGQTTTIDTTSNPSAPP
jgi:hypothetical protein